MFFPEGLFQSDYAFCSNFGKLFSNPCGCHRYLSSKNTLSSQPNLSPTRRLCPLLASQSAGVLVAVLVAVSFRLLCLLPRNNAILNRLQVTQTLGFFSLWRHYAIFCKTAKNGFITRRSAVRSCPPPPIKSTKYAGTKVAVFPRGCAGTADGCRADVHRALPGQAGCAAGSSGRTIGRFGPASSAQAQHGPLDGASPSVRPIHARIRRDGRDLTEDRNSGLSAGAFSNAYQNHLRALPHQER